MTVTKTIEFEGQTFEYDWQVNARQAMVIKDGTGWGLRTFDRLVDDWDPVAAKWHWWLLNDKNGIHIDVDKIPDDWNLSGYLDVLHEATILRAVELVTARQREEAGKTPKGSKRGIVSSTASKKPAATKTSARSTRRTSSGSPTSAT